MVELPLTWFTIYSWSLPMACPPLICNFRFRLKPSNQMLFNNIGFPTKGGIYHVLAHIHKKVVLLSYLSTLRLWILDIGSFTNSECTFFWKGKQVYTRLFGLWPSGQGGHSIYFPKYKGEENVFLFFLIINLLTVILWVTKACRCFKKRKQPYTRFFFDNIAFLITVGQKIRL